MATIEELERVHELLEDCKKSYHGIGVIQSILNEITQTLPKRPSRSRTEVSKGDGGKTDNHYEELISILPYSLWPSML